MGLCLFISAWDECLTVLPLEEAGRGIPFPVALVILGRAFIWSFHFLRSGLHGEPLALHRWEQCWSLLGMSSLLLSSAKWSSPFLERAYQLGLLPLGEGPSATTATGGLLKLLPHRHRCRPCGDLEGLPLLLQGVGNQAKVSEAVFL